MPTTAADNVLKWRLYEMMGKRRMNNRTLAELTGLHEGSISRLKNAETLDRIDTRTLESLCRALNCSPNDLIEMTDEQGK